MSNVDLSPAVFQGRAGDRLTGTARTVMSANELARALISMAARSTTLRSKAGHTAVDPAHWTPWG